MKCHQDAPPGIRRGRVATNLISENDVKIPADALVLVADGRKAILLANRGDAQYPNLQVETSMEAEEGDAARELGTDRPGRSFESVGHHRHAVEQTDFHDRAEETFAEEVAAMLERKLRGDDSAKVIVVAPPRTLAHLRPALAKMSDGRIIADLAKDLTNHPVSEIENILAAS